MNYAIVVLLKSSFYIPASDKDVTAVYPNYRYPNRPGVSRDFLIYGKYAAVGGHG
jgi:hypothetical protein